MANSDGLDGATSVVAGHVASGQVHNSRVSRVHQSSAEKDVTVITVLKNRAADSVARRWDSQVVLAAAGIVLRPVLVAVDLMVSVDRMVSVVARVLVVGKNSVGHADLGHAI